MSIFPELPADLDQAGSRRLRRFIAESQKTAESIAANPDEFLTDDVTVAVLLEETAAGVAAIEKAREELARRKAEVKADDDDKEDEEGDAEEPEGDAAAAAKTDDFSEKFAELAARARSEVAEPEGEEEDVVKVEGVVEEEEAVVAAAAEEDKPHLEPVRPRRSLPKPTAERQALESQTLQSLVAAVDGLGPNLGADVDSEEIATMMIKRRREFGNIAPGTEDKITIARADWADSYPSDRQLTADADVNWGRINRVVDQGLIKRNLDERKAKSLTASGGLCAPVTPYYQLQMLSMADRPVRAALPSFNADRGGLRFARPAALTAVTTGVGTKTVGQDAAGGTTAAKTCQVIPCPAFSEVDVAIIYHCLQFGNLGARTFPELVAQWNSLVLAAHARTAETLLLTGIDTASTAVTAASVTGAVGNLFGQILAAANGMRNRHRMNPEAVLRILLPDWSVDLLVSDVIRSQFQRFDTDEERITALLRSFDVEPTFYIDGATGAGQVFGAQAAGALLKFPTTVRWYLYPEGSFLYLDGGVLELGLVRDSVLNATNDFQIFGESFENVAFIGVESLAVTSTLCDSGATSLPLALTC